MKKRLLDFAAILQIWRKDKEREFDYLPKMDGFVKSERERRFSALTRATRSVGMPYVISPATPEEQVQILRRAMKKTFQDLEFQTEFRTLAGEGSQPANARKRRRRGRYHVIPRALNSSVQAY